MHDRAPYIPRQLVRVVRALDRDIYDVSGFIGRQGVVERLEYEGCGQSYPGDPLVEVRFDDGRREAFWREELARPVRKEAA